MRGVCKEISSRLNLSIWWMHTIINLEVDLRGTKAFLYAHQWWIQCTGLISRGKFRRIGRLVRSEQKRRELGHPPLSLTVKFNSRVDNFVPEYLLITRDDQ